MPNPNTQSFEKVLRAAMNYAVEHAYIDGRVKVEPLVLGSQVEAILAAHLATIDQRVGDVLTTERDILMSQAVSSNPADYVSFHTTAINRLSDRIASLKKESKE